MKRINKEFIISTIICFIPTIIGLLVYGRLTDEIPTKWYSDGTVGQYQPKEFTIFLMPLFLAVINGVTHFVLNTDPKRQNIGKAFIILGKWLCPVLSVLMVSNSILWSLGYQFDINKIMPIIMGILFVVLGNYMPKTRRNYTAGIRLPWTLNSDENWRKTHHLAAILWVISGCAMIILSFIPKISAVFIVFAPMVFMVLIPCIYSYFLYRKGI